MTNNWASSLELMVSCVGIKMACLLDDNKDSSESVGVQ